MSAARRNAAEDKADLDIRFALGLAQLGFSPTSRAALAVSGGGDSIALMLLYADWARHQRAVSPTVLIVDHGLREESAKEAAMVAGWARAQGLSARVLQWKKNAKPQTGIEAQARAARYRLLGQWCATHDIPALFLAHTREDQAETFLLRLGRGSGVDGLAAMNPRAPFPIAGFGGVQLLRPLLDIGRAELRAYLSARGALWLEDPMNEDLRFARVRIRKTLPALESAGIPTQRIAEAAQHLARAREALEEMTQSFLATHARLDGDFAAIDAAALRTVHREIGLRALSTVLMRLSGASYRPRFERLQALFDAIIAGDFAPRTLCGCRVGLAPRAKAVFGQATLLITREGRRNSARKAEEQDQRPVELGKVACAKLPDSAADLAASDRDQLVDH
jgi:tRNA(Ile)-lysidine synthase